MRFTDYDTRLAAYAVVVAGANVLLTWWNGEGRSTPAWSLPGGGVEFAETVEEAVRREVHEETGLHVEVGQPLLVRSHTDRSRPGRPFKAVQVIVEATAVGGELGTIEVGGSTDRAAWVPLAEVARQPSRTDVVDVGIAAWRSRHPAGA